VNDRIEDPIRVGDHAGVEGLGLTGEGPLDVLRVISPFDVWTLRDNDHGAEPVILGFGFSAEPGQTAPVPRRTVGTRALRHVAAHSFVTVEQSPNGDEAVRARSLAVLRPARPGCSSAPGEHTRAINARPSSGTVSEMSDDHEFRPTPILASDAERERSIALLRDAVSEGRLTLEEFSERVGLAHAARTDQDLPI
jgi:hypothetical protein